MAMHNQINNRTIAVVGVLLAMASLSVAQSRSAVLKVNVPFRFFVMDKLFPAGECTVQRTGEHGDALVFRAANLHLVQMQLVNSREVAGKIDASKLVFHRYGDEYYLTEVWSAGDDRASRLMEGSREMQLARGMRPRTTNIIAAQLAAVGK